MAGKGWIKLHRKIRDSSIFNDHQLFRLWMICLTEATHKERDQLIDKQTVHLMPGEFVTGRYDIDKLYNNGLKRSEKVTGEKTVYRWLEKLEKGGFLTIKKTNKFSIVSIDNWAFYQGEESSDDHQIDQQMTNKRPSNDHQMTTNKNVKNVKNVENVKEDINNSAEPVVQHEGYHVDFESFWTVYPKFRRKDKAKTFGIWKKKIKESERQLLIQCTERYAADKKTIGPTGQFAKMPSTYLNAGTYKDYLSGGDENEAIQSSTGSTGKYSEFIIE
jgi:Fe2+ or Zn2+ uptake regulation protein